MITQPKAHDRTSFNIQTKKEVAENVFGSSTKYVFPDELLFFLLLSLPLPRSSPTSPPISPPPDREIALPVRILRLQAFAISFSCKPGDYRSERQYKLQLMNRLSNHQFVCLMRKGKKNFFYVLLLLLETVNNSQNHGIRKHKLPGYCNCKKLPRGT